MKDKIWFTYKARIQAYQRLEWLDFHSQMLLVWYAILSTILGVLSIRFSDFLGCNTDLIATVLSVALLGFSLAVTNRDFRGRAMAMRSNYLKLQNLYNDLCLSNAQPSPEQVNTYNELLADSENHTEIDDRIARLFATGLTSRQLTCYERASAYYSFFMRKGIVFLLYISPLVVGFGAWISSHECV